MTMPIWRLTEMGREIGLVDDERWARFEIKKNQFDNEMKRLDSIKLKPVKETNAKVEEMGFKAVDRCGDRQGIPSPSRSFLPRCGGLHRASCRGLG